MVDMSMFDDEYRREEEWKAHEAKLHRDELATLRARVGELERENAALTELVEWQPMEDAPRTPPRLSPKSKMSEDISATKLSTGRMEAAKTSRPSDQAGSTTETDTDTLRSGLSRSAGGTLNLAGSKRPFEPTPR